MIGELLGRPSPTLRRSQIFLVLFFWVWRLYKGDGANPFPHGSSSTGTAIGPMPLGRRPGTPRRRKTVLLRLWVMLFGRSSYTMGWVGRVNDRLRDFTPYQLVLGTLTFMYALRHLNDLFGLTAPEPLAMLYSRSYYRATWVNTAFDAGFASAMSIRPKWFKDIMSVMFAFYYMVFASEGDEVLRRFRALCTVEMLRVTWEKTNNPYVRLITYFHRPALPIIEHLTIPRPSVSSRSHLPPVKAMLFFSGSRAQLEKCTDLVVDFPGGGFIAMGPECHEERLRLWAKRTGKPVLGVNYGKAPEYPYPWAIEEGFDAYRTLMETKGRCIGIRSGKLGIVLTGDSAGGNICATIMLRILEHPTPIPRPISIILAYPALDFNFTSWMSPANLRALRAEQSETHIPGLVEGKDHMRHKSPLSVIDDTGRPKSGRRREKSWSQTITEKIPGLTISTATSPVDPKRPLKSPAVSPSSWTRSLPRNVSHKLSTLLRVEQEENAVSSADERVSSEASDSEDDTETVMAGDGRREADKSLKERVKTPKLEKKFDLPRVDSPTIMNENEEIILHSKEKQTPKKKKKAPIGTRLTMTSRVGYFQDRVITPSMMRAMAILYIGPQRNPDFETDYYISPILSPPHLLAHFPPVYLLCGERDPFVDDTVIFAGKIREAKRRRKAEAELKQQKSAKFGEGLRMSTAKTQEVQDHILRETDEDWVQLRIIEGWGHGFMQMTSLMREVEGVLVEMADWIDESFQKAVSVKRDVKDIAFAQSMVTTLAPPNEAAVISPIEHLAPHLSTHVKPTAEYKKTDSAQLVGYPDLGGLTTHDIDNDGENEGVLSFVPKSRKKISPPPSKYTPVPRRSSKESLTLPRNNSAPRFDLDETGSSGEAVMLKTPPLAAKYIASPELARGSGAFAFFGGGKKSSNGDPNARKLDPAAILAPYGTVPKATSRRSSSSAGKDGPSNRATNSLVAAAVAGARAASPALAAAGLVPQQVENISEAELFRRRRMEAVFGMGDTESAVHSEDEADGDGDVEDGY